MKGKKKNGSLLSVLILGLAAIMIAVVLSCAVAYCVTSEYITQESASGAVPVVIAVSVFASAVIAASRAEPNVKLLSALGVAAVYLAVCIAMKLAMFPGTTEFLLRNVLVCAAAALAAGIIGGRAGKRKPKQYAKRRR